jgi:hypothetical protein
MGRGTIHWQIFGPCLHPEIQDWVKNYFFFRALASYIKGPFLGPANSA